MEEKRAVKIKPIPSLDEISGGGSDIAKVMQPIVGLEPVSMARSTMGSEEVTTGIPLGLTGMPMVRPEVPKIPPNEDVKYGKAFGVAKKTFSKFKVETVEAYIDLVEEIKNNL